MSSTKLFRFEQRQEFRVHPDLSDAEWRWNAFAQFTPLAKTPNRE
jgi:hypothetical protein